MLYKTLLTLHLFGLTIGTGTGFYIAAVARHAGRNMDASEARTLIPGVNGALSKLGTLGLALLLVSGVGLALMADPAAFNAAFQVKMALVAAIVIYVGAMQILAARSRRAGSMNAVLLMKRIGPLGPLLGVATLAAAVAAFH
ncbi:MAG: hypothetical protein OEW21_11970 [Betaproteobacteria bacterium]|nr:hypothetical protein [Betaproteobacteria bacterium]